VYRSAAVDNEPTHALLELPPDQSAPIFPVPSLQLDIVS
jgi:hypothetical protein